MSMRSKELAAIHKGHGNKLISVLVNKPFLRQSIFTQNVY